MSVLLSLAPAQAGASTQRARFLDRGPGLRRGENSSPVNLAPSYQSHAAFRLHHVLPPLRSDLHRIDARSAAAGGATSVRPQRQPYGSLQYPPTCLVRDLSRFCVRLYSRAADEGMAAHVEDQVDRCRQSRMAGCDSGYSVVSFAPAQAGAPMHKARPLNRGPGLRRGGGDRARTDVLLHAVLEVAGVVG